MDTHTDPTQNASVVPHEDKSTQKKPAVISVKTALFIAGGIIFAALAFYYKGAFIAATVDGSLVSRLSVISELEKTYGKQALDSIITKKLLSNEAQAKGITVTDEEVAAEVQKIEDRVKAQGGTLDAVLSAQGMTRVGMEEAVGLQLKLEKLIADKIQVTDEDITKFFAAQKISIPKGQEEMYRTQAREQIRTQKINETGVSFVDELRSRASIKYFSNY